VHIDSRMARLLYRILRVANVVGRVDEDKLRKAMTSSTMMESIARIAELDKPLSYALPMTGNAMAPLFNMHLLEYTGVSPTRQGNETCRETASAKENKDTLVIRRLNPSPQTFLNRVHVNDVVVIQDPNDERRKYVRRIAAMEGTQMVSESPGDKPIRIPEDHCWVLRDNLNAASAPDSSFFGPLSLKNILGRVMYAIRTATDHGRVTNSPYGMASDAIVLAQESVAPFVDEHGRKHRPGGLDDTKSTEGDGGNV
jgi:hypothetical protein